VATNALRKRFWRPNHPDRTRRTARSSGEPEGVSSHRGVARPRLVRLAAVTAVAAALVVACDEQQPAFCDDLDAIRALVDDVRSVDVTAESLESLSGNLERLDTELKQLRNDASDEFADEIRAVESAEDAMRRSLDSARTDPSASTFTDVVSSAGALGSSFGDLDDAVGSTC
jgi:hypothetical protein